MTADGGALQRLGVQGYSRNVLGVFAAARDNTGRKKAEERFRAVIEAAPDAMVIVNREGRIVLVNAQTQKLFGYGRQELLGQPVEMLVPQRFRGGHPGHRTGFFTRPTARRWALAWTFTASVRTDRISDRDQPESTGDGGRYAGLQHNPRYHSEKQASQYARSLIEASVDPLVTISLEGKIMDVNEAAVKVTGAPREKLIGADFADYFTEPEMAREGYQQALPKACHGLSADNPAHRWTPLPRAVQRFGLQRCQRQSARRLCRRSRCHPAEKAELELADQRTRELERLAELERFQKLTVAATKDD